MGNTEVKPVSNDFDAHEDAIKLNNAMKGLGTDESAIIQVVTERNSQQRQAIREDYKKSFLRNLTDDLESELSGYFKEAVLALINTKEEYEAKQLHRAMEGLGTDEDTLVEILCCQTNSSMQKINKIYSDMYNRALLDDITSDTSGDFRKFVVAMTTAERDDSYTVDRESAAEDAKRLFDAGVNKFFGTDESTFNSILTTRNYLQLRVIFEIYEGIAGYSFEHSIEAETSGDLLNGYKIIVAMVTDHLGYYATKLHDTMQGLGTDEKGLIRYITTRDEVDLKLIKKRYKEMFGRELWTDIDGDCSGDFKELLLSIVNAA